jgi:hypothetical protein
MGKTYRLGSAPTVKPAPKPKMKQLEARDFGFFKFGAFKGMPWWGWIFLAAMVSCALFLR